MLPETWLPTCTVVTALVFPVACQCRLNGAAIEGRGKVRRLP